MIVFGKLGTKIQVRRIKWCKYSQKNTHFPTRSRVSKVFYCPKKWNHLNQTSIKREMSSSEHRLIELERKVANLTHICDNLKSEVMQRLSSVGLMGIIDESTVLTGGIGHSGDLELEIGPSAKQAQAAETKVEKTLPAIIPDLKPLDGIEPQRRINKVRAAIPSEDVANPIAALINLCIHQMKFNVIFKIEEIPSSNPSEPDYQTKVIFPGSMQVSEFTHSRKRLSKEKAARLTLRRLNEDDELLSKIVELSFQL
jgi:hypothetical protein